MQADSGTIVFLTTHYLEEAERADQVCIIAGGRIVSTGSPLEFTQRLVGRQLLDLDADDRDRLRAELRARAVPFEEGPPLRIAAGAAEVQALLRAIETPLSVVRTHAPTLEDAYLDIISNAGHNGDE